MNTSKGFMRNHGGFIVLVCVCARALTSPSGVVFTDIVSSRSFVRQLRRQVILSPCEAFLLNYSHAISTLADHASARGWPFET